MDKIIRATGQKAPLRYVLTDCTEAANAVADGHEARGQTRELLGKTMVGALILASGLKSQGVVQLRFTFSGDISFVHADATPLGHVRAAIPQPEILKAGKAALSLAEREIHVYKRNETGKQLFESVVPMASANIGRALTGYLLQSEQVRSSVGIFAECENGGEKLRYCAGFQIEAFPDADDATLKRAEAAILAMPGPMHFALRGGGFDLGKLLQAVAGSMDYQVHKELDVVPTCPCSLQSAENSLGILGAAAMREYIEKKEQAEVICDFCRKKYLVPPSRIAELAARMEN